MLSLLQLVALKPLFASRLVGEISIKKLFLTGRIDTSLRFPTESEWVFFKSLLRQVEFIPLFGFLPVGVVFFNKLTPAGRICNSLLFWASQRSFF